MVLLYPTDHLSAPAVMVLSQNLKKAGVNVDLQSMDWASLAARRLKKIRPRRAAGTCSDLGRLLRRQHAGHQPWLSAACGNSLPGWPCDKELDELRTAWIRETDAGKRKELAARIQERAYQTVPYVMWGEFKPCTPRAA